MLLCWFCRLLAFIGMKFFVIGNQHRRADFLLAALLADDVDQVGTGKLQLAFLAKLHELLQVNTGHSKPNSQ